MAFLSDAHFPVSGERITVAKAQSRRLNWRLILALAFNVLAWIAIVRAIVWLF